MLELIAFYLYAMTALASGMIFIAGIFFNAGAEFLGVVQILVYAGAVMAMYAFGMMFFDSAKQVREKNKQITIICILSFGVALILVVIISLPRLLSIEDSVINAAYCNDCGYSNCSQKYR